MARSMTRGPAGAFSPSDTKSSAGADQVDEDASPSHRGHESFEAAFQEALRLAQGGVQPREIRLRRNQGSRSYTWSVRY